MDGVVQPVRGEKRKRIEEGRDRRVNPTCHVDATSVLNGLSHDMD